MKQLNKRERVCYNKHEKKELRQQFPFDSTAKDGGKLYSYLKKE